MPNHGQSFITCATLAASQRKATVQESVDDKLPVADVSEGQPTARAATSGNRATSRPSSAAGEMTNRQYELTGKVTTVDCGKASNGQLALRINSVLMKFCYAKLSRLQVSGTANSVKLPACNSWKGM